MDHEELETFLILKYGSIQNLYVLYKRTPEDFLNEEEKRVLADYWGVEVSTIEMLKRNTQRAMHGVW